MALFLQVVGGFVIAILIVLVAAFFYLKRKLAKALGSGAINNEQPLTINLNEDLVPDWLESPSAKSLIDDLVNLGFRKGAAYSIPQMEDISLFSMFKGDYLAVVYGHTMLGNWADIACETTEGLEITATSAPMGEEIDSGSHTRKIFMKEATAAQLFEQLQSESSNTQLINLETLDFRQYFEDSYKKDIAWRNQNGGTTIDEYRKIAKNGEIDVTDAQLAEAFLDAKVAELHQWCDAGVKEFLTDKEEDHSYDGDLFIVPRKTDAKAFFHYLSDWEMVEEDKLDKLVSKLSQNHNIPSLFNTLNNCLSPDLQAQKLGEIDFPIKADVYLKKYAD